MELGSARFPLAFSFPRGYLSSLALTLTNFQLFFPLSRSTNRAFCPPFFSLVLCLFVFLVLYHGRQVEIASSLDFLWKQQARKELEEMSEMRRHTNQLLHNILPNHVAKYFLDQDRQTEIKVSET